MKKTLMLIAAALLGLAAVGCDPAPKDEPTTTSKASDVKTEAPKPADDKAKADLK